MKITFGLLLDGYQPVGSIQELDHLTCGPVGLVQVLETRLGLRFKAVPVPQRVAQYLALLESGTGPAFFAASLSKDPVAVAETLLDWRDRLIEAGWDGTAAATDSPRLRDMATVEARTAGALGLGMADRLRAILSDLASRSAHLESVVVLEARDVLPTLWQRVCDLLGARYGVGAPLLNQPQAQDNDLGKVRTALTSPGSLASPKLTLQGDDSLVCLTAFSELTLARAAAQISARARNDGRSQTIIAGSQSLALEQAVLAAGEPALGLDPLSPFRPIPQTLALALRLYWEPLDLRAVLEFLAHPICPVPAVLRDSLKAAVVETPGIGGTRWQAAIQQAKERVETIHQGDPQNRQEALAKQERALSEWLLVPRSEPAVGAKGATLAACCSRIARWAGARASDAALPPVDCGQFMALSAFGSEMADLLRDRALVSRSQLERLLQQASAAGWAGGATTAELGCARRALHSGAILDPADLVIWWDFQEPPPPPRPPWTTTELEQLGQHGAHFVPPEAAAANERANWLRPLLAARRQLVLVTPRQKAGEEVPPHPLHARLRALVPKDATFPTADMDGVLTEEAQSGLVEVQPVVHCPLPPLRRWWKLSSGQHLQPRTEESYTSLEKFIYSPYAWVLQYGARLGTGVVMQARLSDLSRLKGNLLHRLLDLLLAAPPEQIRWATATREQLDAWVDGQWNLLLEQEAAVLLLPGQLSEAAALLVTGKAALWQLLRQLRAARVAGATSNQKLPAASFAGGTLGGILDLAVTNDRGESAVIDLKFGGTDARREELEENRQLQLALYGYLWSAAQAGCWPATAFYVLSRQNLLAQDAGFFPDASVVYAKVSAAGPRGCWADFQEVWRWRRAQLDQGWIELTVQGAGDLPPMEGEPNPTPPLDRWRARDDQDKYNNFDALTGWRANA